MAGDYWYIGYNLVIHSELEVCGASRVTERMAACAAPDIEIVKGNAGILPDRARLGPFAFSGDTLFFEAPKIAKFLCQAGRRIIVEPHDGATERDVCDILVATALPILLWMQLNAIMLHACGIVLDGGAIGVCGVSGGGKSTVLKEAVERGAHVVGDDTLRVQQVLEGFRISGLPAQYCWDVCSGENRVRHDVPADRVMRTAPLAALFVLELPRATGAAQFTKLSGGERLNAILEHHHRPLVPRLLGCSAALLPLAARLAGLPLFSWRRSEQSPELSDYEYDFLASVSATDTLTTKQRDVI
ncbi:hypothetical protein FHS83_002282 [Rhizomicrobium palustre]|uniref:HPr kinase/phosphorylase C-terminal domain-containing protein n=1 Tax=Rhizomicrobium palustre TaxID=189966 RepID=A0A846MZ77_9PROT|nr:hypothetical protein [Rhizomicrobium palustre]NIK88964.1 hypothetical protein [Rhizomicrobium palustre]